MRRKRQQSGSIFKARGNWYVRYFEDRVVDGQLRHNRIAKQIGPVPTRGKRPPHRIEDEAREIVAAATVTNANPERVLTVGEFVKRVYIPQIEQYKRPSTLRGYRDIWENHVKVRCAGDWLKDIRTFHVQNWLNSIAGPGTLSRNTLKHIKTFVSAVFKLAKQQGYYEGENPVRDTSTSPRATAPRETYAYDLTEIQQMLSVMPEPAATIVAVAAFTGLRRGELQGLRWEDYEDGQIRVSRAIWEGHVNDPKTGRSKGAVPVIKHVAERLEDEKVSEVARLARGTAGTRQQLVCARRSGESNPADTATHEREHDQHVLHQDGSHPGHRRDGKAATGTADSLSGNEVTTDKWKAAASPAVN